MDPKEANRLISDWFKTFDDEPLDLFKTVPSNPNQIDIVDGLIRRSSDFSNHIRGIKAHVQARFSAGGSVPEGVLYLVYRKTEGNIEPLYLGKAEAKGRKGSISSLFKNGGQVRYAENIGSNGHIGNLNEAWKGSGSYGHWFKTMFSTPIVVPPTLFEPVYIHMEIWESHSISVAPSLGHMSLSAEEMIRIDLLYQVGMPLLLNNIGNSLGISITPPKKYFTGNVKDLRKISSVYDIYNVEIESLAKKWFQSKQELLAPGTILPDWPKVVLSDEDPPIFITNPYIKKMYEEDRDEGPALDFPPDVEEWLGCYIPEKKTIVLWSKGIHLCAKRLFAGRDENGRPLMGIPEEDLFNCVYVHELGHWFSHVAHTPNGICWNLNQIHEALPEGHDEAFGYSSKKSLEPFDSGIKSLKDDQGYSVAPEGLHDSWSYGPDFFKGKVTLANSGNSYSLSSSSYHEVWAQWFAWLYGHEMDSGVLKAFELLERLQSSPYKAWRKLVDSAPNPDRGLYAERPYVLSDLRFAQKRILESLEWSRSHGIPVTFDDAHHPATNMLGWL